MPSYCHDYDDDAEDREHDEARQSMLDALHEGQQAGMQGHGAEMCPYHPINPEYNEWQRGRLMTLGANRRVA